MWARGDYVELRINETKYVYAGLRETTRVLSFDTHGARVPLLERARKTRAESVRGYARKASVSVRTLTAAVPHSVEHEPVSGAFYSSFSLNTAASYDALLFLTCGIKLLPSPQHAARSTVENEE